MKTKAKTGRKQQDHRNSATGLPVVGLSKMKDGRWRIIGTQTRFTEPDEQRAIARFHQLNGDTDRALLDRVTQRIEQADRAIDPLSDQNSPWWAEVARYIREKPTWVAVATGIEQIGYLRDLKAPEPELTIKQLEKHWEDHYKKSPEQKRRVINAWDDFKKTTGITTLGQITPAVCRDFADNVTARGLEGKSQSNMFTRIRRLFTFVRSRDIAMELLAKVIDATKRMVPAEYHVNLNPKPIAPEAFHKLLKSADDKTKAMLLLMLNGAFTITEVIRIKWDEIKKGTIITRRKKSGRCIRVCVLWAETIAALAKIQRRGEYIFLSREGLKYTTSGADKWFRSARIAAELPEGITASHCRDGAATALAEAGTTAVIFSIAMGHSSGIKDHYIARNPKMVAPASEAIHRAYFG